MSEIIYQKIKGELVPKSGNERGPNRRYHNVNGLTVEFTPEEEKERDREEQEWEEQRPIREAEARRQHEEFEKFKESLIYKVKLVAFMDVLGWAEATRDSKNDIESVKNLGLTLNISKSMGSRVKWMRDREFPGDVNVSQFSDCIVISAEPTVLGKEELIRHVDWITRGFFSQQFLVRGSIVIGEIYHDQEMVFGPALVEAYKNERSRAKYPRIILQKELADQWGQGDKYFDKDGSLIGRAKTWRMCPVDGEVYYDFLQPQFARPGMSVNITTLDAELGPVYEYLIKELCDTDKCEKVSAKLLWLANYYNAVVDEYPEYGGKKIEGTYGLISVKALKA